MAGIGEGLYERDGCDGMRCGVDLQLYCADRRGCGSGAAVRVGAWAWLWCAWCKSPKDTEVVQAWEMGSSNMQVQVNADGNVGYAG
jgi:hypothetical protein